MNLPARALVVLLALHPNVLVLAQEPAAPAAPKAPAKAAKVDINAASEEALRKLPGITQARAKAIVDGRCYEALDELVDRRILPGAVYEKIKDQLVVGQSAKDRPCVAASPASSDSKSPKK